MSREVKALFVGHNGTKIAAESTLGEVRGIAMHWGSEDLFSDHEQGFKVAGRKVLPRTFTILLVCMRTNEFFYFKILLECCDSFGSGHSCGLCANSWGKGREKNIK